MSTATSDSHFLPPFQDASVPLELIDGSGRRWSIAEDQAWIAVRWDESGDRILEAWVGDERLPLPIVAALPPEMRMAVDLGGLVVVHDDPAPEDVERWLDNRMPILAQDWRERRARRDRGL